VPGGEEQFDRSSVIQCPQSGMTASSTLSAAHQITVPISGPKVASPPKAFFS
jgi:hypothetical protein